MTSLKDLDDEQLLQALKDAENEVQRLRQEIRFRSVSHYGPKLFDAVGDATRKALDTPSMMERSRIEHPLDEIDRLCGYGIESNEPTFLFAFAVVPPGVAREGNLRIVPAHVRGDRDFVVPLSPVLYGREDSYMVAELVAARVEEVLANWKTVEEK